MAVNQKEMDFITSVLGEDIWPDHEKHVYHIRKPLREASAYFYEDSDGSPRMDNTLGHTALETSHNDSAERRFYIITHTDSGQTPSFNDHLGWIIQGLGEQ